jgi:localization factor PodJL
MSGGAPAIPEATPLAALAVTPAEAVPAGGSEQAATLYEQGIEQLDAGDPAAVETLTQAANLGLTAAQVALVQIYPDGSNGAVADASKARAWAQRAAEGGDPKGMHTYGMYLYEGVGAAPDQAAGMRWLRKAAERGLIDSQYNVAKLYEDGAPGIARDPVEALKWYLIAARAGDEGAEAAVDRLQAKLGSAERQRARAAAEAFQAEPLA